MLTKSLAVACDLALLPVPALAQQKGGGQAIDMRALPCQVLLDIGDEERTAFIFWIDGYLSHASGDTTLDPSFMGEMTKDIMTKCIQQPTRGFMDVVREIYGS